jgi:hypothetical protein
VEDVIKRIKASSELAGSCHDCGIQILHAEIIRDFALLIYFEDGKRVIYDFMAYATQPRFKDLDIPFEDFKIVSEGLTWGNEIITAKSLYETGIDFDKVEAKA